MLFLVQCWEIIRTEFLLYDLQIANCEVALGRKFPVKTRWKFAVENLKKSWDLCVQVGKGFIPT